MISVLIISPLLYFVDNFTLDQSGALFKNGSELVDFQPQIEKKKACPLGFKKFPLNPIKRCRDRYRVEDNGTLVLEFASSRFPKPTFDVNEYCFNLNHKAGHKYHHFPKVCQDNNVSTIEEMG